MWWWGPCAGAACCTDALQLRETRAQALDDLRPLQLERTSTSSLLPDASATSPSSSSSPFPGLYTARHRHSHELVALKVFRKELLTRRDARRRLRREVRVLSLCRGHPHLLTLVGVYSSPATFEIAFELARGGEVLRRVLAPPPPVYVFSEKEVSRVIASVVEGLRFLHARGIVHGEVRPEHMLYSDTEPDARVLLAGFGRAAPWSTGAFTLKSRRNNAQQQRFLWDDTHHVRFLPPFALRRKDDTLRSWREAQQLDTWALGVTMYALLCASLPFDCDEDAVRLERTTQSVLSAPVQFPDDGATISRAAKDLLQRLLAKHPDDALTIEQVGAHPWIRDGVGTAEPWSEKRIDAHRAFATAYGDEVASEARRRRVSIHTYSFALRERAPPGATQDNRSSISRDEFLDVCHPPPLLPQEPSSDSDEANWREAPSFVSTNGDTQQIMEMMQVEDEPPSADGFMRMASEEIDACLDREEDSAESPQVASPSKAPSDSGGYRKMDSKLWRVLTKQRRFFSFRSASSSSGSLTKSDSDTQ